MSEEKFTPGPWMFTVDGCNNQIETARDGILFCDEQYYPWCSPNDHDWPLVAAAPDLYKELKHLTDLLNLAMTIGKLDIPGLATLNGAQAALRKARGEK